jgi:hypothetical protein
MAPKKAKGAASSSKHHCGQRKPNYLADTPFSGRKPRAALHRSLPAGRRDSNGVVTANDHHELGQSFSLLTLPTAAA